MRSAENESLVKDLFLKHYRPLTAFAYKFVGNIDEAKDVVQSVFIRLLQNNYLAELSANPKSYLFKAVANECLNAIKKSRTRSLHEEAYGEEIATVTLLEAMEETEQELKIFNAINTLPPKCREIFMMSRLHDRKNKEIADQLNISLRTVETHISNALRTLRASLRSWLLF
jgi:RNA polymerase sigma-70 factor (ECF subfamily)